LLPISQQSCRSCPVPSEWQPFFPFPPLPTTDLVNSAAPRSCPVISLFYLDCNPIQPPCHLKSNLRRLSALPLPLVIQNRPAFN
jgi:hypothetical protein